MSQTYNVGCTLCKQSIWIGQGSYANQKKGYLYSNPEASEILFDFLINHKGHELIFDTRDRITDMGLEEGDDGDCGDWREWGEGFSGECGEYDLVGRVERTSLF